MPPLRRDAERNRERLIAEARALFAERGIGVPLEEIATRAGVSIGTLYNRFPNREALVDAVFWDRDATVEQLARDALRDDDPWRGFASFVERGCELQAADLGYNDVASRRVPGAASTEAARERTAALMAQIVERAQRAGALRPDLTVEDLAFLVWGVSRTVEATSQVAPEMWRRHLALMLDGLRTEAAPPLPRPPMTPEQVREAMSGRSRGV